MPSHPRRPTLRRHLRRAVRRTLALTAASALVVVGGAGVAQVGTPADPSPGTSYETPVPGRAADLFEQYDCSVTGFGDGRTPRSAIVRADGDIRVVTFQEGWRVHVTRGPATLVGVCLEPPRGRR